MQRLGANSRYLREGSSETNSAWDGTQGLYLVLQELFIAGSGDAVGSQGTQDNQLYSFALMGGRGVGGTKIEKQAFLSLASCGSFKLAQGCGSWKRGEMTDGLLGFFSPTMVLPGHDGAATPNLGGFIYQLSW